MDDALAVNAQGEFGAVPAKHAGGQGQRINHERQRKNAQRAAPGMDHFFRRLWMVTEPTIPAKPKNMAIASDALLSRPDSSRSCSRITNRSSTELAYRRGVALAGGQP